MKVILIAISIFFSLFSFSQKEYAKTILDTLCSPRYAGRGYVDDGVEKASVYLANELKSWGVAPFPNHSYFQNYSFGVNTFPYDISVSLDDKELIIGQDYLVDAMSGTAQGKFEVFEVNSKNYLQYKNDLNQAGKIIVYNFTDLTNRDSILFFKKLAYKTIEYTPAVWINKNKMMYTVGRRAFKYLLI